MLKILVAIEFIDIERNIKSQLIGKLYEFRIPVEE